MYNYCDDMDRRMDVFTCSRYARMHAQLLLLMMFADLCA
jgi:hypothetical protein